MSASQISLLVHALRWLTWLVGLSLALLSAGLICLNIRNESGYSANPQGIDRPAQPVQSVARLTPALKKGKLLFTTHCQVCHELSAARVVGPGLLGVTERVPDRAWLIKWIRNPAALLQSGDVYANHMVDAFAPVVMPGFPALKENDVEALIDYIGSYKSEATGFVQ